ncbi:MAG TPA: hypothetical protein PK760_09540, partial [Flavobacteriales bacterium]|nr:hypothetical protein [Flavobacteriales bacterium]
KRLKADLLPHEAHTVRDMGWNGKGNGELLRLMKEGSFDAILTFDKNMAYQQNFKQYDVPVIVLDAEDNTYLSLAPLIPSVLQLLRTGATAGPNLIR